jgi:hypothetical protein
VNNLTTLTASGDADREGVSDRDEYPADTDPLDRSPSLRLVRYDVTRPGGVLVQTLEFTSQSSRLSLATGIWQDADFGLFQGQPVSTPLKLGSPALPQRFYRVTVRRPLAH